MKTFVGVLICMGLNPLPEIVLYWSKNKLNKNLLVKIAITRERFLLLRQFGTSQIILKMKYVLKDRLHKIRIIV